jgi:ubiquinone/menaquinone biosynthesis C-methylase UbiE
VNDKEYYNRIGIETGSTLKQCLCDSIAVYKQIRHISPDLYKNKIILDVGCGNGHLVHYFAKHGAKAAIGTDIAFYYIKSGQQEHEFSVYNEKLRPGENTNVSFINSDAEKLPFKNSSFEMILAVALLHHVKEKSNFISECRRILVPGGRMVIVDPNGGHFLRNIVNRYARKIHFLTDTEEAIDIAQLKNILNRNGFSVEEIKFEIFFGDLSAQLAVIIFKKNRILGKIFQYFTLLCFAIDMFLDATLFKLFPNLGWRFFILARKEIC